jgi:hypothetical protein
MTGIIIGMSLLERIWRRIRESVSPGRAPDLCFDGNTGFAHA